MNPNSSGVRKICELMLFTVSISFILICCKKNPQDAAPPAVQPSSRSVKVDTTFEFTATYQGSSYPAFAIEKTVYVPALDTIGNPFLKVYRSRPQATSQEIQPYSQNGQNAWAYYRRNKGFITYSEFIIGLPSVKVSLRITATW